MEKDNMVIVKVVGVKTIHNEMAEKYSTFVVAIYDSGEVITKPYQLNIQPVKSALFNEGIQVI